MTASAHIIHPSARDNPRKFELAEMTKIERELREKYADELTHASGWKKMRLTMKIAAEAATIYRSRLYAARMPKS